MIRAKVPPKLNKHPKRKLNGMKKCQKQCGTCPRVREGKVIQSNKFTWEIRQKVNCETYNIIYMIECNIEKCKARYIGESERPLKNRFAEHKGYIKSIFPTQTTGQNFNQPGHSAHFGTECDGVT